MFRASIRSVVVWGGVAVALMVAALSPSCVFSSATTLCEAAGIRCRPGQVCAAKDDVCIESGGCGDGVLDPRAEICDDGNVQDGDGCSSDCTSLEVCGNGVMDVGEDCDDGNVLPGDDCSPDCVLEACGNGVVDVNEDCDSGSVDAPTCNRDCTAVACGDGHTNLAAGEQCDTMGVATAECLASVCRASTCGDSFTNALAGEACDTGSDSQFCNGNCRPAACGDRYVNPAFTPPGAPGPEVCDEGGDTATCDGDCSRPACGDGYVNRAFAPDGVEVEQCDDGPFNADRADACRTNCRRPTCGDGIADSNEECDAGALNSDSAADGCRRNCRRASCGDGVIDAGEECDDGALANSDHRPDACRRDCRLPFCGDGVIDPTRQEVCDGAAPSSADGCPAGQDCLSDCTACL